MNFVLYTLFMFQTIDKDWNATESFEFHGVIGDHSPMNSNENLVNYDPCTSAVISRICGA